MGSTKGNPEKVHPAMAKKALELVKGDRTAAYSQYIQLHYRTTGRLAPGCNNVDLQKFYDLNNL